MGLVACWSEPAIEQLIQALAAPARALAAILSVWESSHHRKWCRRPTATPIPHTSLSLRSELFDNNFPNSPNRKCLRYERPPRRHDCCVRHHRSDPLLFPPPDASRALRLSLRRRRKTRRWPLSLAIRPTTRSLPTRLPRTKRPCL